MPSNPARINGGAPSVLRLVHRLERLQTSIARAKGERLESLKAEAARIEAELVEQRTAIESALEVLKGRESSAPAAE